MEQNPSWEIDNNSAIQEIYRILWNMKVRQCVHKIPPLDPILSYLNPVQNLTPHVSKIHLNLGL
jgi:hypothetical protein